MSLFIAWAVGSLVVALIARFCGRSLATVIATSTGGGMVVCQLWGTWMLNNATSFRDAKAVLVMYAIGAGIAAATAAIAQVAHRLINRGPGPARTVARGAAAASLNARTGATASAPLPGWPEAIGILSVAIALLLLGGPYLSVSAMGSAPLATIDPLLCAVVLATLVAWLVAFSCAWWLVAFAMGVLACCLTIIPLLGGSRTILGEPTSISGGWLLGLASVGLAAGPLMAQLARMRERQLSPGSQALGLSAAVVTPLLLLAGAFFALVSFSEQARAAMHPSPQAAFADWAALAWKNDVRSPRKEALESILRERARGSPTWWSRAFPTLLADSDPAIRHAAVNVNIGSSRQVVWSDEVMSALLKDPEPRIRNKAIRLAMAGKNQVPEDPVLTGAVEAAFTPTPSGGNHLSPSDLEAWVGHERMVRVLAELVMTTTGRVRDSLIYEIWVANERNEHQGTLIPDILALVIADAQPARQAGCLDLLMRDFPYNHPWRPSREICAVVDGLTSQAGGLGKQATACLESLRRRGCCGR